MPFRDPQRGQSGASRPALDRVRAHRYAHLTAGATTRAYYLGGNCPVTASRMSLAQKAVGGNLGR